MIIIYKNIYYILQMNKQKEQLKSLLSNLESAQKELNSGSGFIGLKNKVGGGSLPDISDAVPHLVNGLSKLLEASQKGGLLTGGQMQGYMSTIGRALGGEMHSYMETQGRALGGEQQQYFSSGGEQQQYFSSGDSKAGEGAGIGPLITKGLTGVRGTAKKAGSRTGGSRTTGGEANTFSADPQGAKGFNSGAPAVVMSAPSAPSAPKAKRAPSAWNTHVASVRAQHPELSFKEVLIEAKNTYNK